jgi:DNA-binding transcriptional regulator YdaS (Cro superfamily)
MGADMDLKSYLRPMSLEARQAFAKRCGTSRGHLQNICYGKKCAAELAVAIERESGGDVTRQELRPKDYWQVWPELPAPKPAKASRSRGPAAVPA